MLINGIYDEDIRKEVLGATGLDEKSLMDTLGVVENKETALRSMPGRAGGRADALSGYRGQKKSEKSDPRLQLTGKCETCKKEFKNRQLRTNRNKPDEIRILKLCSECWAENRKKLKKGGAQNNAATKDGADDSSAATDGDQHDCFLAAEDGGWQVVARRRARNHRQGQRQVSADMVSAAEAAIPAMVWDCNRGWVQRSEGHGRIKLTVFTREGDLRRFNIQHSPVGPAEVSVVADSGCQLPIMGMEIYTVWASRRKTWSGSVPPLRRSAAKRLTLSASSC